MDVPGSVVGLRPALAGSHVGADSALAGVLNVKERVDSRLYTVDREARPAHGNGRPKPESHVESATSILALPPTIPRNPVDSRPYTVDGGWARLQKPTTKAGMSCGISDIHSCGASYRPQEQARGWSGPTGWERDRNKAGMSHEISGMASSRLHQGFRAGTPQGSASQRGPRPQPKADSSLRSE